MVIWWLVAVALALALVIALFIRLHNAQPADDYWTCMDNQMAATRSQPVSASDAFEFANAQCQTYMPDTLSREEALSIWTEKWSSMASPQP